MEEKQLIVPGTKVLALSWKQPFGSLMLYGKWETRQWQTNYRGLVLICTTKESYGIDELELIAGEYQMDRIIATLKNDTTKHLDGFAIGLGKITDCRFMLEADEDRCFMAYRPDRYVHVYDEVVPIEPFPWKGSQGWSEVPEEVKQKIKTRE